MTPCVISALMSSVLFYNVGNRIKKYPLNEQVRPNFDWYCIVCMYSNVVVMRMYENHNENHRLHPLHRKQVLFFSDPSMIKSNQRLFVTCAEYNSEMLTYRP